MKSSQKTHTDCQTFEVNPEQSKIIEPVSNAILIMNQEGHRYLAMYV